MKRIKSKYSSRYLEMATRRDKRRTIKKPDGYGKRTGDCGDTVEMYLIVRKNRIHKISFITDGCNSNGQMH